MNRFNRKKKNSINSDFTMWKKKSLVNRITLALCLFRIVTLADNLVNKTNKNVNVKTADLAPSCNSNTRFKGWGERWWYWLSVWEIEQFTCFSVSVVSNSKVVWTGKVDVQSATEKKEVKTSTGWMSARKMINTQTYWSGKFMRLNGQKAKECFA